VREGSTAIVSAVFSFSFSSFFLSGKIQGVGVFSSKRQAYHQGQSQDDAKGEDYDSSPTKERW